MRPFIRFALFLFPLSAFAEFVDAYGNPVVPAEIYRRLPGLAPTNPVPDRRTGLMV
jgi:hypothetical protein